MPVKLQAILDAPIIEIDTIDSTNNYAMRLIDADTALPGLTIVTKEQTAGKGQRGRQWTDVQGESLLMSIIVQPRHHLTDQFAFIACVSTAIAEVLMKMYENWDVRIKWPNDIIINDKKAGGVLIENVLRGSAWVYSIIGLGLNVKQTRMPASLPYASSLAIEAGMQFDIEHLLHLIRDKVLLNVYSDHPPKGVNELYNEYLYRKGFLQSFTNEAGEWKAKVLEAKDDGKLLVMLEDGTQAEYTHGTVNWNWEQ